MTVEGSERSSTEQERDEARKRLQNKRDLTRHAVTFIVINSLVVVIWATSGRGYFWPGWLIGCWGFGLLMHTWDVLWRRPITEADIDKELRRTR